MHQNKQENGGVAGIILAILALLFLVFLAGALFFGSKTINELLGENKKLKQAITNLTEETQIGYAKVIAQETKEKLLTDQIFTKLLFVETDRNDPMKKILQREYEIEGDTVHFDCLVVKFSNQMVMDGKERSLYLWRRVYGEEMKPKEGFPIEISGTAPERYKDITEKLKMKDRNLFWTEIWNLANNPSKLAKLGVKAIDGQVTYKKLKPGLIYVFKIDNKGGMVTQVVPDI